MEDILYYSELYDIYKNLLTEKQQLYFEEYYFNNLSLGEISEKLGVSRNAVHKVIQGMEEKLTFYEEKLCLYKKSNIIYDIMGKIEDKDLKKKLEELL